MYCSAPCGAGRYCLNTRAGMRHIVRPSHRHHTIASQQKQNKHPIVSYPILPFCERTHDAPPWRFFSLKYAQGNNQPAVRKCTFSGPNTHEW